MRVKFFGCFMAASLIFASLLAVFVQQSASAGPQVDEEGHHSHSSPGKDLREGLRAEAQVERNRGNDATADRLDAMADRLNAGNISDAEASDISREVATGNFDRADSLVDRSSRSPN